MDASGDGVLAFAAGAAFRQGAEAPDEFDEAFAPGREFGHLLGQTIYFYSKDGKSGAFYRSRICAQRISIKFPAIKKLARKPKAAIYGGLNMAVATTPFMTPKPLSGNYGALSMGFGIISKTPAST